jgi:acyl carrier protein
MTDKDIIAVIRNELGRIAPEIDFEHADRRRPIHEEFDIDSMDFLNFITALHARLGVNVPEADYAKVATIAGAVTYLAEKTGA